MNLFDIIRRSPPTAWQDAEKIPWHEPDFSRRMLKSHLSQEHDWASRRSEIIDRHVELIVNRLPSRARILDLGCGPGLYTQRLARRGFDCTGVDFSPASIEYARAQADDAGLKVEYVLEDIRNFVPHGTFDAVLLTFGEFNVFRQSDAVAILQKTANCLDDTGFLLLEIQTFDAVKNLGLASATWQANTSGVFSDQPHLCLTETFWDENSATATTRHFVIDAATANVCQYGSSTQAYRDEAIRRMLHHAGFANVETLTAADWPPGKDFDGKLEACLSHRAN